MSDFLNWELTNRMHNLGYDGKTLMYIDNEEDIINDDSAELIGAKPAILTSAAFRWFREKYKLIGLVKRDINRNYNGWWFEILSQIEEKYNPILLYSEDFNKDTYEEAELACLRKLIEIVKQK